MPCAPQWIDWKSLLARVPLFEGMPPGELAQIADSAREINAPRGQTLFRKNEACAGLYLVIYGQVKLFFTSPQGYEKILDIADQGHTFGEATLFQGRNHQVDAQTLSDCLLLHIAKPVIMAQLEKSPAFARRVIDSLSQRLFQLTLDVESYSLDSGRQRVINYLVREARRARLKGPPAPALAETPGDGPDAVTLTLLTSKSVIASRLNVTQEHFSRLLHELSACGLLSVSGRDIHIKDLARLRQYARHSGLPPEQPAREPVMKEARASTTETKAGTGAGLPG